MNLLSGLLEDLKVLGLFLTACALITGLGWVWYQIIQVLWGDEWYEEPKRCVRCGSEITDYELSVELGDGGTICEDCNRCQ